MEKEDREDRWEKMLGGEPKGQHWEIPFVGGWESFNISSSVSTAVFWFLLCSHLLVYLSALELSVTQESLCGIWGKGDPGMGQPSAEQGRERKVATQPRVMLGTWGGREHSRCPEWPRWTWMKNPHLPAAQLLARKIEEGSLGISRKGDCVLHNIKSHVV